VVHVYNILDLLQLADSCNASQLLKMSLYHVQSMVHVVKQMEEWDALPQSLKNSVLKM
jgi:hypothetical protein